MRRPKHRQNCFSAQFLYKGAKEFGESGVYVSFGEKRETFIDCMKDFGFDFERLEADGKFAFMEVIDARTLVHTVLGKIVRETGCMTLLVSESPAENGSIGLGIEEFVSNGVILLKRKVYNGRVLREMEVVKLRGTRINHPTLTFT